MLVFENDVSFGFEFHLITSTIGEVLGFYLYFFCLFKILLLPGIVTYFKLEYFPEEGLGAVALFIILFIFFWPFPGDDDGRKRRKKDNNIDASKRLRYKELIRIFKENLKESAEFLKNFK